MLPDATPAVDRRRAIWIMVVAAVGVVVEVGRAQDPFSVTYTVERGTGSGPARVSGRVLNESTTDALDVYVTAEAVDASGKVLGRGIVFVSGSIPARGVVPFSIAIPAAQAATTFRVRVSSYRLGIGQQQAG